MKGPAQLTATTASVWQATAAATQFPTPQPPFLAVKHIETCQQGASVIFPGASQKMRRGPGPRPAALLIYRVMEASKSNKGLLIMHLSRVLLIPGFSGWISGVLNTDES